MDAAYTIPAFFPSFFHYWELNQKTTEPHPQLCFILLRGSVSPSCPGWPPTYDTPASASWEAGTKGATTPSLFKNFFFKARDGTQGLMLVRQVLYH